jgi:hypothetical protein
MSKFQFINGVDLDESKVTLENGELIEYEMTESLSMLYDKNKKNFYLYYIDYDDTCDEFTYELDDNFNGIEVDGFTVSKKDYDDFKELVSKVA